MRLAAYLGAVMIVPAGLANLLACRLDASDIANGDGSLTLCVPTKSPGKDKESNRLPAPEGDFSLSARARFRAEAMAASGPRRTRRAEDLAVGFFALQVRLMR